MAQYYEEESYETIGSLNNAVKILKQLIAGIPPNAPSKVSFSKVHQYIENVADHLGVVLNGYAQLCTNLSNELDSCKAHISRLCLENQTLKALKIDHDQIQSFKDKEALQQEKIRKQEESILKFEMRQQQMERDIKLYNLEKEESIIKKKAHLEEQKKKREAKVLVERGKLKEMKEIVSAFEQFTENEKETASTLGWFNSSVTTEYRVGIMFQVARLHNNKRIMSRFTPKCIRKGSLKEPTRNIMPYVRVFYNSLALDKDCKDMSDVDIVYSETTITDEDVSAQEYTAQPDWNSSSTDPPPVNSDGEQ